MNAATVNRFREAVSLTVGDGETVYLNRHNARKLGLALMQCADDIEALEFKDSVFGSVEVPLIDKK